MMVLAFPPFAESDIKSIGTLGPPNSPGVRSRSMADPLNATTVFPSGLNTGLE